MASMHTRRARFLTLMALGLGAFVNGSVAAGTKGGGDSGSATTAPTATIPIQGQLLPAFELTPKNRDAIAAAYRKGDWPALRKATADSLAAKIPGCQSLSVFFLDLQTNAKLKQVSITPVRYAYTKDPSEPFGSRLFGPETCDVSIGDPSFVVSSSYTAQRAPDPTVAALQKVVTTIVGGIPKSAPVDAGGGRASPSPLAWPEPSTYQISVKKLVVAPDGDKTKGGDYLIEKRVTLQIADSVVESDAALSGRQKAVKDYNDKVAKNTDTLPLKAPETAATASLATTYNLAPLTRFSFGLGAGVVLATNLNTPVNIPSDATKPVTQNNFTGLLTLVAVNIHPIRFDESLFRESWGERWKLILPGFILTPAPGIGAGMGLDIVRGLGVMGGYGVTLNTVLREGDVLGAASKTPENPTKRGAVGVWFVGIEYTLQ